MNKWINENKLKESKIFTKKSLKESNYFDLYSVVLSVNVRVIINDKKGFEELKDYDLVLNSTDYTIRNFSAGQDEFGYLTDDISRSDMFSYEWTKLDDNTIKLSVFYYEKGDKTHPIMNYILTPVFEKY